MNKGLVEIQTALQDMVAFWKDEVHRLIDITSQPEETFRTALDESGVPAEKWQGYQKVIMTANSSIMESSDAVLINDPRTPPNTMDVSQISQIRRQMHGAANSQVDHGERSRHRSRMDTDDSMDEKFGFVDHHSGCCLIM